MARRQATAALAQPINDDTPPPIGHNQPRPMTPEEVQSYLAEICTPERQRAEEIKAGITRALATYPVVPNEDVQGRLGDFAGQRGAIQSFLKVCEAKRTEHKQPYLLAERMVDGFFKTLVADIERGRATIRERMTIFATKLEADRREAARKEAEAAAARAAAAAEEAAKTMAPEKLDQAADLAVAAEHAEAQVTAKPAEHSRVYGQYGSVTSLRSNWKFFEEKSDLMTLVKAVAEGRAPLDYLAFNTVRIGYAVRSEQVRQIAGCAIEEVKSV